MSAFYSHPLFKKKCKVLVIGAGRSGIAATKLLLSKSVNVILYDDSDEKHLLYFKDSGLSNNGALTTCFKQAMSEIFDAVVLSPGVSPEHHLVTKAKAAQIPIISEIDLAISYLPSVKMIGITGSNGKSTTTVMMESILRCAGFKTIACGNLGVPLCDVAMSIKDNNIDYLVVELSSFQLDTTFAKAFYGAIIVNITPDHLDRYVSFQAYKDAKLKIATLIKDDGVLVINKDLKDSHINAKTAYFESADFGKGNFAFLNDANIKGDHNKENALAAAVLAQNIAISKEHILTGLNTYKPLPHRCEFVGQKNGVSFINDSKGTTVVAVKNALSMQAGGIHLLLGGIEKGEDFSKLSSCAYPQIRGYYIFGRAKDKIYREVNSPNAHVFIDLNSATEAAFKNAKPGDTVLLSPGCASYDQFDNYEHRGEVFKALFREF